MIHLFRRIRQGLLSQNRFSKYLLYAIGEIILVVIGILIALQVNNWNQKRLDTIERHAILKNMNLEFKANKNQVLWDINLNNNIVSNGKILLELMGSGEDILKEKNLDSLILKLFYYGSKDFPENTITELIQTGQRKYVQNDTLKNLIYDWTHKKESIVYFFGEVNSKARQLLSYFHKRYPLKNLNAYDNNIHWKEFEFSKLNIDKLSIFNDIEFENLLNDYLVTINNFILTERNLQNVIEQIIKATEIYDH